MWNVLKWVLKTREHGGGKSETILLGDLGPACVCPQAGFELSVARGQEEKLVPLAKTQRTAEGGQMMENAISLPRTLS